MNFLKNVNTPQLIENIFLGIAQILLWGGSYFSLAVIGKSMVETTGWSHEFIYGCLSFAMFISGLISPKIGKIISRSDKNYILLLAGIVMGIGLIIIGLSTHKIFFIIGWLIVGIAMGMGLYDTLFSSLGKKYGKNAMLSITQVTLISGFTTTFCWPFLSFLNSSYGWRNTLLIYGVILILSIFPIHYYSFFKPKNHRIDLKEIDKNSIPELTQTTQKIPQLKAVFYLLAWNFTVGTLLMTGIYVYLIDIIKNYGFTTNEAIAITTLLGPSQVAIRGLDLILPKRTPIKTAIISSTTIFIGMVFINLTGSIAFLGVILFGLGNGLRSILRGTLPLWIFGQKNYAVMMGKLALMPLISQALTPLIGGIIIQYFNIQGFGYFMCILAALNIVPMLLLNKVIHGRRYHPKRYFSKRKLVH